MAVLGLGLAHIPTRMGFHSDTLSENKLVQGCRLVVFVLGRHGNHMTGSRPMADDLYRRPRQ